MLGVDEVVEIGVGSDIRGRMEDEDGMESGILGLAECLIELVTPAPSLADEVRLPEFAWSSDGLTVWDF